ncbi:MAG: hypothetical protein ACKO14_06030 [Armatimonadota bacterium]
MVIPPIQAPPPLRATWSGVSTKDGFAQLKDANVRWGALGISAASLLISPSLTKPSQLRVSGGFRAERGGDKLIGKTIFFDVDKQLLLGETISIQHDVFRIDTGGVSRGPLGMSLSDVVIVDNVPEQSRTLAISASKLSYSRPSGQWNIQNLGLSLYRTHLLTVPSVRFQTGSTASASRATRFQLPVSIRQSGISGPVATLTYATQPLPGFGAAVLFEQTAKRGDAASLALSYEVANQTPRQPASPDEDTEGLPFTDRTSILTEPPAVKRDVVPSLQLPSVLGPGIGGAGTSAVSLTMAERQEVIRRYKSVLVDNKPLVAISSSWVMGTSAVEAHFETGERLETDLQTTVSSYRTKASLRLRSMVPVLNHRIPIEVQTVRVVANDAYSYTQLSTELIPRGIGSRLSAALSVRDIQGRATYYSDVLEAPSELQLRLNTPLSGWHLALGSRLDLTSNHFFDTEFVVAAPGRVIRPEIRYRTRGNQFAINIAMPFFSL